MIMEGMLIFLKKQNTVDDSLNIEENENREETKKTHTCFRVFLALKYLSLTYSIYILSSVKSKILNGLKQKTSLAKT